MHFRAFSIKHPSKPLVSSFFTSTFVAVSTLEWFLSFVFNTLGLSRACWVMTFPELLYREVEGEGMTARLFWEHHSLLASVPWVFLGSATFWRESWATRALLSSVCVASSSVLLTHGLHALGQGAACVCRDLRGEQPGNVRTSFPYRPTLGSAGRSSVQPQTAVRRVLSCRKSWQKLWSAEPSPSTTNQPSQASDSS